MGYDMFEIQYKIVPFDYDEFVGQDGFLKIRVNDSYFGEIWPDELDDVMETEYLCDWMERLARVCEYLETNDYVALSETDSDSRWIEFKREGGNVFISLVEAPKKIGSGIIERESLEVTAYEWKNQAVSYQEFCDELYLKIGEYIRCLKENNENTDGFKYLLDAFEAVKSIEDKAFCDEVLQGLTHKGEELLQLRTCAFRYKSLGMNEQEMLNSLEALRKKVGREEEEDVILVLMDQIGGWCHKDLRIF